MNWITVSVVLLVLLTVSSAQEREKYLEGESIHERGMGEMEINRDGEGRIIDSKTESPLQRRLHERHRSNPHAHRRHSMDHNGDSQQHDRYNNDGSIRK